MDYIYTIIGLVLVISGSFAYEFIKKKRKKAR
jgi:hypothetical protein